MFIHLCNTPQKSHYREPFVKLNEALLKVKKIESSVFFFSFASSFKDRLCKFLGTNEVIQVPAINKTYASAKRKKLDMLVYKHEETINF